MSDARFQAATAIYADRSLESYAGVLAALMAGHAYVPLNPKFPDVRNRAIISLSGAGAVIAGQDAARRVAAMIDGMDDIALVMDQPDLPATPPVAQRDNQYAYILFTSGSTGEPKGVPISHANVNAYLSTAASLLDLGPQDKFSQTFDLTFDLSVHDMFLCWRSGAELVVPSEADLEQPHEYVGRAGLSVWFSVPSLGQKFALQGKLTPGSMPGLRLSLFCGEALPLALARSWQAATGQRVENWYGPTEATIAFTRYVLPPVGVAVSAPHDLTPLGHCLPGMEAIVMAASGALAVPDETGELLVKGPQVADGYLNDPAKTAAVFVRVPGRDGIYYRTGDRVKLCEDGSFQFLDRIDNQIKIRGYRVEIGEIEAQLRAISGGHTAVVTPLPLKSSIPTALIASIEGYAGDLTALRSKLAGILPAYMVPTKILAFPIFPKNASGKVDRGQIGAIASEGTTADDRSLFPIRPYLIKVAKRINPALDRETILNASNLMEAGLDSIAFTEFAMEIEKSYGIELDQPMVVMLSESPVDKIVRFIRKRANNLPGSTDPAKSDASPPSKLDAKGAGAKVGVPQPKRPVGAAPARPAVKGANPGGAKALDSRSVRVADMLALFPEFVETAAHPLGLFIGSSGTFGGISTKFAESVARGLNKPVTAANLSSGMLSNMGVAELVEFVRDVLKASGKPVQFIAYELDPATLSVFPYAVHTEIVANLRAGIVAPPRVKANERPGRWVMARGGAQRDADADTVQVDTTTSSAEWLRARARQVIDIYQGRTDFIPMEREIWLAGARMVQEVTQNPVAFIHPARQEKSETPNGTKLDDLLAQIRGRIDFPLIGHSDFGFDSADFSDAFHSNAHSGREKLTGLITRVALGADGNGR